MSRSSPRPRPRSSPSFMSRPFLRPRPRSSPASMSRSSPSSVSVPPLVHVPLLPCCPGPAPPVVHVPPFPVR
jgi:hypothetical protein